MIEGYIAVDTQEKEYHAGDILENEHIYPEKRFCFEFYHPSNPIFNYWLAEGYTNQKECFCGGYECDKIILKEKISLEDVYAYIRHKYFSFEDYKRFKEQRLGLWEWALKETIKALKENILLLLLP